MPVQAAGMLFPGPHFSIHLQRLSSVLLRSLLAIGHLVICSNSAGMPHFDVGTFSSFVQMFLPSFCSICKRRSIASCAFI